VLLYRLKLGWLLGQRFLLLRHTGRKSGRTRETVIEVVRREADGPVYYVTSGWGEASQWYRNVMAEPQVRVTVGRRTFRARAERLAVDAAESVLREYASRHGTAARALGRIFGSQDPQELAQVLPVIALRGLGVGGRAPAGRAGGARRSAR
jgi:deazaflavin-dependent oxidoreductase (nitroreductase family)